MFDYADAYYEWSALKKPYLVYLEDKVRPFVMAGLYDHWKNPEVINRSLHKAEMIKEVCQ